MPFDDEEILDDAPFEEEAPIIEAPKERETSLAITLGGPVVLLLCMIAIMRSNTTATKPAYKLSPEVERIMMNTKFVSDMQKDLKTYTFQDSAYSAYRDSLIRTFQLKQKD